MKFIVDAQLPRILVTHLIALGHDAVHVKDLPKAGDTSDAEITAFADVNDRIVVTKDADFRHTHEAAGRPERLLHIRTGNVPNRELLTHISTHHAAITSAFAEADFIELGNNALILHPRRSGTERQKRGLE
jgi:predicted nuclease of predicted toxin-antitoxin system